MNPATTTQRLLIQTLVRTRVRTTFQQYPGLVVVRQRWHYNVAWHAIWRDHLVLVREMSVVRVSTWFRSWLPDWRPAQLAGQPSPNNEPEGTDKAGPIMKKLWQDLILAGDPDKIPPRKRLLAILDAAPDGSYGFYMHKILTIAEAVVGSAFAGSVGGSIDEFFAAQWNDLVKPYAPELSTKLATAETQYWSNQTGMDYFAGQLLGVRSRDALMAWTVSFSVWWNS